MSSNIITALLLLSSMSLLPLPTSAEWEDDRLSLAPLSRSISDETENVSSESSRGEIDRDFGIALERRDIERALSLLANGADPDLRLRHGKTALMSAAKIGSAELVGEIIRLGADINALNDNGGSALMFAAIPGDAETISLLIDHGAEIDHRGHFDWTALMVAASKGHAGGIRILLDHGADPAQQDSYGFTPLMRAVQGNKSAAVTTLLAYEPKALEAKNERGATALHIAVEENLPLLVKTLLEHGADPSTPDNAGYDPAHKATAHGYHEVLSLLAHSSEKR
ncbi:ankyrin repeat domain-containing protein [Thioalkalivibrio sp. HK1]|uniref:ankyrin repeat domain-containing protein n=1 Tax=Thioalkalivibrio sp. HK1 TaxID=1469245 RepID=UPI0004708CFF|nr:ankyrin repeat domain-containing protein [Thioalkalivibrio sp. HK1]